MSGRLRICFVAPHAWPVLARDRRIEIVGGSEVQQTILAREFARRGHDVSMVCLNFGQSDGAVVDGVTVHRAHAPRAGIPGLRFLHPRLSSIWKAMARADADIYYQQNAGALTAFVCAFARRSNRVAIYAGASDADFDPSLPMVPIARDRALFRWAVRRANAVVAQHPFQAEACMRTFGRESCVIRSTYSHKGLPGSHEGNVIWVGTLKPIKAPELFVELARACPNRRFRMIGGGDQAYVNKIKELARGVENLQFSGFIPHADIEPQFDGAAAIVNTSPTEGFPNTFLQAWSRGIPTLSFVDPRLTWRGRAAGAVVRNVEEMGRVLDCWTESPREWADAGEVCRNAFDATFGVQTVLEQYEALFDSQLASCVGRTQAAREAVQ